MAYATTSDVQSRMLRTMSEDETAMCSVLLDDAAALIDSYNTTATDEIKGIVSCRMVVRALGDGQTAGVPMGATQGSMSALGYTQSWTIGRGGSAGDLYLAKADRQLLGILGAIGSRSPVEDLVPEAEATT